MRLEIESDEELKAAVAAVDAIRKKHVRHVGKHVRRMNLPCHQSIREKAFADAWIKTNETKHDPSMLLCGKRYSPKCKASVVVCAINTASILANARLMEAAPDLLVALKAAETVMNYMGDKLNGMDAVGAEDEKVFPAFDKVRAAIAKAEGR